MKDGVLTGAFATPNCKGEEKVVRLRKRFPSLADTLIEAWGDSADDIPMLTQADVAHCVGHLNSRDIDSARNKN